MLPLNDDIKMIGISALAFFAAGIISFAVSPLVMRFAKLVGAIDIPKDDRRMHNKPITRLGGLSIFSGFIITVLIFNFNEISTQLAGILIGAVVITVLGVVDDILALKAWIKLAFQIVAAVIPVMCGVVADVFTNPLYIFTGGLSYMNLGMLAYPLTVIWIVVITNSVNLIDGLDGLAAGVSSIASLSMLLIAISLDIPQVALLMAALAGGCIGFIPFNFNPAKMFMGDAGAMFLGYILATVSILGLFKFYAVISFAVPFLLLGLPIFDTVTAIFRRLSKGKSPMSPDRGHVHHKLIDMGFSQKQSVTILYIMSAVLGITAVVLATTGEARAILLLISVLLAAGFGVKAVIGNKVQINVENDDKNDDSEGKT